jgi:hypothetical protein
VKENRKQGNEYNPTAKASERSEKSRDERDDRYEDGEFQDGHLNFPLG